MAETFNPNPPIFKATVDAAAITRGRSLNMTGSFASSRSIEVPDNNESEEDQSGLSMRALMAPVRRSAPKTIDWKG